MPKGKTGSFEDSLKRLEAIVEELERGDLSLEHSLQRYEEGMQLSKLCQKRLDDAQRRIEVLTRTAGGKLSTRPLEAGELDEGTGSPA